MTKKIGILGASSQVGSSLALYLKHLYDCEVTSFTRSPYSDVFFELFELPAMRLDIRNDDLKSVIVGYDVIVDCTYPSGQLYEIPGIIKETSSTVISAMKPGSAYIYMSSIMAYGMPPGEKQLQEYKIPRSTYAYIKRLAEKEVKETCRSRGVNAYIFRLGQVHGFLQSVNASYREKLRSNAVFYIDGREDDLTNTVFISSICEAVIRCAAGEQSPGLYTLVSSPQWTLKELHGYYLRQYNVDSALEFIPAAGHKKGNGIVGKMMNVARRQRPLIESYVLMKSPGLSIKLKGKYRESEARSAGSKNKPVYPDFHLLGRPVHSSVSGVESNVEQISLKEKQIESYYNAIVERASCAL